ncbi:MAG: hypothetical protein ACYDC3_15560 [Candidatus Binataceae bacterium]
MRFIDRISKFWKNEKIDRLLREAVKVRIQNVEDYWTQFFDRQNVTVDVKRDFPCIVPPWPLMYAEWSHKFRDPNEALFTDCGVITTTERREDGGFEILFLIFRGMSAAAPSQMRGEICGIVIPRSARSHGEPIDSEVESAVMTPPSGSILQSALEVAPPGALSDYEAYQEAMSRSGWEILQPLMLAISFAHCKNVQIVEGVGRSLRARRHKEVPDDLWRVLQIDPMRKVIERETAGLGPAEAYQRAMHICRGHFKTYDEENPLFGKLVGTFWWQAHVRGDSRFGTVSKEYNFKAGNRDSA